jgi:DNA-binding winged helix-turn-helix (wHTH) protein/tetratricopeptide (TPR) repeat protein
MSTSVSGPALVRFGVFEADLRSGELRKSGVRIKIQELPFQALRVLLSHPNEVVNRDLLRQALWPDDVYVDFDRGVISAINRLRDALGDSAENPVFIETVGRRGYRWVAPTLGPMPVVPGTAFEARTSQETFADTATGTPVTATQHSPSWIWLLFVPAMVVFVTGTFYRISHSSINPAATASAASSTTAGRHAVDHEAEDFYLKGRFFWNERTPESLNKAVDAFTQAIVHDPGYAPAYVGLADSYNLLREYSVMPAAEAYSRALAAAKKAVELDNGSSEAHASLAFVAYNGMWDAAIADREFRSAIELNPKNSSAHLWYATMLASLGRYPQALQEIERAQALDPASRAILADKGRILWVSGRREESLALLQQMEAAEPKFISPHRYLRFAYLESRDYPNYLKELKHESSLTKDPSQIAIADAAARGFASGGERGLLANLLREQEDLYKAGKLSAYFVAETRAQVGDKQGAMRYLEAANKQRAEGLNDVETDSAFKDMHSDPAFRQFIAKIGLPPLG